MLKASTWVILQNPLLVGLFVIALFGISLLGLGLWHASHDNLQLLFWYDCFSQHKQLLKSCGRLSQLGSYSLPPKHTSLILYNDRSNLICMSGKQIEWTHSPTLHYSSVLILQLYTLEFLCSAVLNLGFYFYHVWYSLFVALNIWELFPSFVAWFPLFFFFFFCVFLYFFISSMECTAKVLDSFSIF